MNLKKSNLFESIPETINYLPNEIFEELVKSNKVRIERILSQGHASAPSDWYDQDENEWLMVVQGQGKLEFKDGKLLELFVGDHLNIPARTKHRVAWTDPDQVTIWLAVFF